MTYLFGTGSSNTWLLGIHRDADGRILAQVWTAPLVWSSVAPFCAALASRTGINRYYVFSSPPSRATAEAVAHGDPLPADARLVVILDVAGGGAEPDTDPEPTAIVTLESKSEWN